MAKDNKSNVPAVTAPPRASRSPLPPVLPPAAQVHAEANGGRGFQAVSSKDGFSAVIKHGKTLIEIQGDEFAVRQID